MDFIKIENLTNLWNHQIKDIERPPRLWKSSEGLIQTGFLN